MIARTSAPALLVAMLALAPHAAHADSPLSSTARTIAHDLGPLPPGLDAVRVVASHLTSDLEAPRGDELTAKIADLVAGALGGGARAERHAMPLVAATGLGHGGAPRVNALVYLDVRLAAGLLRVTADLYPAAVNAWDRLRAPNVLPPPKAHAYAEARVTAEVRAYLPPIQLERSVVTTFTHDVAAPLAVACGDVDGDGGNDLVLVSDREVAWGYLRAGTFVVIHRASTGGMGARLPVPLREPLASVEVAPGAGGATSLFVGWSGREAVALGPDLLPRSRAVGLPVAVEGGVGCAALRPDLGGFDAAPAGCNDGVQMGRAESDAKVVDAFAEVDVIDTGGVVTRVTGSHEPAGALHLRRAGSGGEETGALADVGAAMAIADLDLDGVPDIVTTSAQPPSSRDALVVSSWTKRGLEEKRRWPSTTSIEAVAVCPAEANDAPAIVAVTRSEVWLVR